MSIGERIKTARERLGLTQEDLAEKLEVSRQAVSKWELGASLPSEENLRVLKEILGVDFPPEAAESPEPPSPPAPPSGKTRLWKIAALVLSGLLLVSVISCGIILALRPEGNSTPAASANPEIPVIAGVFFFDEAAAPLQPDLGDGWHSFTAGRRVLMVVRFWYGGEIGVNAVSLYLTPAGTETFDQREQLAVQTIYDGRDLAVFALDIPRDLMAHMDIVLECGGGITVTETLNVTSLQP